MKCYPRTLYLIGLAILSVGLSTVATADVPECGPGVVDWDNDGWGWENNRSCTMPGPTGGGDCVDNDGDGWGWDGSQSCRVGGTTDCIDNDGDGWGWDGSQSCRVGGTNNPGTFDATTITKVFVSAGQSNSVGANSDYDSDLDAPDSSVKVYVWLHDKSTWQKADLSNTNQKWLPESKPGLQSNGLYHIAKEYASFHMNEVIGIIPTGKNERGIDYWVAANGNPKGPLTDINTRVQTALGKTSRNSVELVWWMQGENDANNTDAYRKRFKGLAKYLADRSWFNSSSTRLIASPISRNPGDDTNWTWYPGGDINLFFNALNGEQATVTNYAGSVYTTTVFSNEHAITCSHAPLTPIGYPGSSPNSAYLDDPGDSTHFNAKGFVEIAKRVVSKFRSNCR